MGLWKGVYICIHTVFFQRVNYLVTKIREGKEFSLNGSINNTPICVLCVFLG